MKHNQRGISILAVMMALAATGILAATLAQAMINTKLSFNYVEEHSQRERLRNIVRVKLDCSETVELLPERCTPNSYIAFVMAGETIAPNGYKLGNAMLRAKCSLSKGEFNFFIERKFSNGRKTDSKELKLFDIPWRCS